MLQILGLRPYFDQNKQKDLVRHRFFKKEWRAPSVPDLLRNLEGHLKQIPEDERWNLFFTVANTHGAQPRDFSYQTVMPIDIDHVSDPAKVASVVCQELGLSESLTGIVSSGNGVHLYVALEQPIENAKYFDERRVFYKALCKRVNFALAKAKLSGECDPSVFDHARLMRLPGTKNIKKNKADTECVLLQPHIEPQGFTLEKACGLPDIKVTDQIAPSALKNFPKADTPTVLDECAFLRHCKNNQKTVSELQWYAMLSILPHLEDGRVLSHDYSRGHSGYTSGETDDKIEQAKAASGPRTCDNINGLWDGCRDCKHYGAIKSPILIKGHDYIRTKDTGFYDVIVGEDGKIKKKPNYDDLAKFYRLKHPHVTMESGVYWLFNGKYWVDTSPTAVKAFAEKHFDPSPKENNRHEFCSKIKVQKVVKTDWFDTSIARKVNFGNGVLDLDTMVLSKHDQKFGFRGVLPYDYDPSAECPRFETFLDEITCNREDLKTVLYEYMGYALSGASIWIHKAMILFGDGANGKSTLMDVIKYLLGKDYYSTLSLTALNDDQKRYLLEGKLVNLGDETSTSGLNKSEVFKTMVAGGDLDIKRLYAQPYIIQNKAKLIISCNTLPYNNDNTKGLYRRLMIVPFDATFDEGTTADPHIKEKLSLEAPGIFNKCLEAYEKVVASGKFSESDTMTAVKNEYHFDNDNVAQWFEDSLKLDPEGRIDNASIYTNYKGWCEANGSHPHKNIKFFKDLKSSVPNLGQSRMSLGGKQVRGYKGLSFVSEDF